MAHTQAVSLHAHLVPVRAGRQRPGERIVLAMACMCASVQVRAGAALHVPDARDATLLLLPPCEPRRQPHPQVKQDEVGAVAQLNTPLQLVGPRLQLRQLAAKHCRKAARVEVNLCKHGRTLRHSSSAGVERGEVLGGEV